MQILLSQWELNGEPAELFILLRQNIYEIAFVKIKLQPLGSTPSKL